MTPAAPSHAGHLAPVLFALIVWALLLLAGALYLSLTARTRRRGRTWPPARTALFLTGLTLLGAAFSPDLTAQAHRDVRAHTLQHMLAGMFAPLALTFGWPLTLALRSLPVRAARTVTRALHRGPLTALTSPGAALLLNVGGLWALYFTDLYRLMLTSAALHAFVAAHTVAAGCLYVSTLAGPEPLTRRAPFRMRVVTLLLGAAGHATLAKLMYAQHRPAGTADPPGATEAAARLMYDGGDVAERLLMAAAFHGWYRQRGAARHRPGGPPQDTGRTARLTPDISTHSAGPTTDSAAVTVTPGGGPTATAVLRPAGQRKRSCG